MGNFLFKSIFDHLVEKNLGDSSLVDCGFLHSSDGLVDVVKKVDVIG